MKVVIAHPGVAPFVQHTVRGLYEHEMLAYFQTAYLDHPDYPLANFLKKIGRVISEKYVAELERRSFHEVPYPYIRTYPQWELIRFLGSRLFKNPLISDAIWERGELSFDQYVAKHLPKDLDAVYTYEHAALATLQEGKRRKIATFYEQPSQHHRFFDQIYRHQIATYPEIVNNSSRLFGSPKTDIRNQRRDAELRTADYLMCNSTFTKRTLVNAGIASEKITVTPYGFPVVDPKPRQLGDKVIFLNAGTQNLRKGLHLLYRAWRKAQFSADEAELWLVGKMTLPEQLVRDLPGSVKIWNSIPRSELMELYKQASVFVLPSLADGFAMVISEAMSRGVPVITTENTGGPDVITHGKDGWIVPVGNEEALVNQMKWCVENKHRVEEVSIEAIERAKQWQWSDYREAVAQKIKLKIDEHKTRSS